MTAPRLARRPTRLHARADRSEIHRLTLEAFWWDDDTFGITLQWGSAYGDPVWAIDLEDGHIPDRPRWWRHLIETIVERLER